MTRNARFFHFLRRVAASAWIVLLVLMLFRAQRQSLRKDETWRRVQVSGVLRIGMDASYRPFADLSSGELRGLEVDLAREIAARLGVRAEIVPMGVDGLYDALLSGGVDALISALSYDPFRIGVVLYTRPYLEAGQFLIAHYDSPSVVRMADLEGKTVAVEYGSLGDELARRWARRLRVLHIVRFVSQDEALQAVSAGEADAAIADYVSARLYLNAHPDAALRIAPETVFSDTYAVATRHASLELAQKINAALEALDEDGTLQAIIDRWL